MRLIDADALGIGRCKEGAFENRGYALGWNSAIDIIENAPAVDAEPVRHAEWIPWEHNGKVSKHLMTCSGCRRYQWPKNDVLAFDRCPKCGAFVKREKKNAEATSI